MEGDGGRGSPGGDEKGYINNINLKNKEIYENIVFYFDDPEIKGGSKIILNKVKNRSKINIYVNTHKIKARYSDFGNELTCK